MKKSRTYPTYMAFAAVLIYFTFLFLPGVLGIFYSFTDWNSFHADVNFVGLSNYRRIIAPNQKYMDYISHTAVFTMATTLAKSLVGVLLALLLTYRLVAGKAIHRMAIFTPLVMSYLVVGLVFKSLLHPATGFVNNALRGIGLDFLAKNWLSDASLALWTVISVDTWKGVGYIMVVTIAGLKAISTTYYEAAEIDGASYWQRFFHITLPLIWPTILTITILNLTYGLRVFDIIYALTNGGPGHATDVINTAVFSAFSKGDYAMGTTLSTVLFAFVTAISYFLIKAMENKEDANS